MTTMKLLLLLFLVLTSTILTSCVAFVPHNSSSSNKSKTIRHAVPSELVIPQEREATYGSNVAQYLMDLHDNQAVFDFCGGLMFQLVLSDALYQHLKQVVADDDEHQQQPKIMKYPRMSQMDNYQQDSQADNVSIFHGREIRKVPNAAGGMGFVMQLSLANANDPQGWTQGEMNDYNGWAHDAGRVWRKAADWKKDGFQDFPFGNAAFGLHHRCFLHLDGANRVWLSAEDGCEGTPALMSQGGGGGFSFSNLLNGFKI